MEEDGATQFRYVPGEGLCTDMRAVRKDYFLDHDHSAYVDQWDWERAITAEERNLQFLTPMVQRIWKVIRGAEFYVQEMFPQLRKISTRTSPKSSLFCTQKRY